MTTDLTQNQITTGPTWLATRADPEHTYGAIIDTNDTLHVAYFSTASEAIAYTQGAWAVTPKKIRETADIYAIHVNIRIKSGRVIYDSTTKIYDAKEELGL